MTTSPLPTLDLALRYHEKLPERIRRYLEERGIPDAIQDRFLLGWNGRRITIPIYDEEGRLVSFRLARDPEQPDDGPKMLSAPGAGAELYGWEHLRTPEPALVVCEGEFDRLALEARGFASVTSTGGAGTFRRTWAEALSIVPDLYICFDRDIAGRRGARRIAALLPKARIVELPPEVGDHGDVTDYFIRLGKSPEDFRALLETARPVEADHTASPPPPPLSAASNSSRVSSVAGQDRTEIERLKAAVPLERLLSSRVALRPAGAGTFLGTCPFHDEKTPSFVVYPETRHYHCYGCGAHGDALDYLMRADGLSFPEALAVLRRLAG